MTKQTPIVTAQTAATVVFNSPALVDELGLLKAQIAALEAREKEITQALKDGGCETYAGKLYDCTVSLSERENIDMKRLKADLGDVVAEYLKEPIQITTLRVTAKK